MKELKKLKGHSFKLPDMELTLREPLKQATASHDEMLFSCSNDALLCKVIALEGQMSRLKFQKETMVYQRLAERGPSDNLAQLAASQQVEYKKQPMGMLVLKNVGKPWVLSQELCSIKDERAACRIVGSVLEGLVALHAAGLAFLDLQPDNVMKSSSEGKYCLVNMRRVVQGSLTREQFHQNSLVRGNCQTEFRYASPEMLDPYASWPVDWKADIFCLGLIAYELEYHRFPYETPLAVINMSHQLPHKSPPSILTGLIQQCLTPYEKRRSAKELLEWLACASAEQQNAIARNGPALEAESTFADRFKDALTKMTKESESWVISYTEEGEGEPSMRFVDQLLRKVYRNHGKLGKIYGILCRRASHKLQSSSSCLKLLSLMWNLIRRGPDCCNSSAEKSNFSEAANLIRSHYRRVSQEGLVVEMCTLFNLKQELTDQLKGIFEGNFHLTRIDAFEKISPAFLQKMLAYLQALIASYEKIGGSLQSRTADALVKPILLDDIYDLAGQLVVLFVCLQKDNELHKRKTEWLRPLESPLELCLKRIKGFGATPRLHLITSLQGSLTGYKDAMDFESAEGTSRTTYELYYKTGRLFCGISLPTDFQKQFTAISQQTVKKNDRKSPQSTRIIAADQLSDEGEELNFEAKQIRDCENIISCKQATQSPRRSPKKQATAPNELQNIFSQWGGKQAQKDTVDETKRAKSFASIFADFGQSVVPAAAKKETSLDFDFFMQGDSGSGNGSGKHSLPSCESGNAKQVSFEEVSTPPGKREELPVSNLYSSKQGSASTSGNNNSGNIQACLARNQTDLMYFTNDRVAPSPAAHPTEPRLGNITSNGDIINFTDKPQPVKSAELESLEQEIMQCLKNEDLRKLITESNIVVLWSSISLDRVIGCGSAGEVYLGSFNGSPAAIKKVKSLQQNPSAFKEFEREVVTLIRIGRHPHLVSLLGITKQGDDFYLLMEYCEGGNLFELLHRRVELDIPWKERVGMSLQIAVAMNFLHSGCGVPIIHRDLKSLNILVENKIGSTIGEPIRTKVTDFGLSRNPDAQFMTSALGTLHWMAPELLLNKAYSSKIDVYSFGVVLWEVCSRTTPYKEFKQPLQIMQYVTAQNGRPDMRCLNEGCPQQLRDLIKACLMSDESQRPTFPAIIEALTLLHNR